MPLKRKSKKSIQKTKRLKKSLANSKKNSSHKKRASKSLTSKIIKKQVMPKKTALFLNIPKNNGIKSVNTEKIITQPIAPVLIASEQTVFSAPRRNSKLSPYLLNCKTIKEKTAESERENSEAEIITAEIFNNLNQKTHSVDKYLKNLYQRLKIMLADLRPKAKIKIPAIPKVKIFEKSAEQKQQNKKWFSFDWQLPRFQPQEIKIGRLIIPLYWKKTLLSFIVFCLIIVLPFNLYGYYQNLQGKKNDVLEKTSQALLHLTLSQRAVLAHELYYTEHELRAASQNFSQAKDELNDINFLVQNFIKLIPQLNGQFTTAQKLIEIGEKLSRSAAILTATYDKINFGDSASALNLTDKIIALKDSLNLLLPDLKTANDDMQSLDLSQIPADYQDKIKILQQTLPVLEKNVNNFVSSADLFATLLGQESKKRYLLLFQNNHEIRPTGGFIGSFALVDFDRGNLTKINIPGGGPYDLKGNLEVNIKSPTPLNIMNPRWEFQDANWFADLPTSAEKLIWFYEKSGGPTVDGLIFINATFLENILNITGPIELPDYNLVISADNFFQEIQENVELNPIKTANKPKQIIADLTPKIIDRLLHSDRQKFTELLDTLLNSLTEKELQLYFTNYSLEKLVLNNNWGGQLKNTDKDFLEIVSTNIAGEKTDAKISQKANLEVNVQSDGSVINTLTLIRNHEGVNGELFYGVPNIDYLRIFVPKGAVLLSAEGFSSLPEELFTISDDENYTIDPDLASADFNKKIEPTSQTVIYNENDKTVFANWLKVEPGQSQTIKVQYKLPFTLNLQSTQPDYSAWNLLIKKLNLREETSNTEKYSLLWQKQSGRENFDIRVKINFPENLYYQVIYPDNVVKKDNAFTYIDQLKTDKFLAVIFNAL